MGKGKEGETTRGLPSAVNSGTVSAALRVFEGTGERSTKEVPEAERGIGVQKVVVTWRDTGV